MTSFCKDCKWAFGNSEDAFLKCSNPRFLRKAELDDFLVTGVKMAREARYCSTVRMFGRITALILGHCGKAARGFEPKISAAKDPMPEMLAVNNVLHMRNVCQSR